MTGKTGTRDRCDQQVQLDSLIDEFYGTIDELGSFRTVASCPKPFDQLLDHEAHMTVTVEAFHGDLVNVDVHQTRSIGDELLPASYTREITLATRGNGTLVQYGIVRLDPSALAIDVWKEIHSQAIPLGRVLINHQVLRDVHLCQLWEVVAGPALASRLKIPVGETTYGRTARISCDSRPAIELLEIVRLQE
ncbi:MAG: hypothetical protein AAF670_15225 [Planctomycetota bacterium]